MVINKKPGIRKGKEVDTEVSLAEKSFLSEVIGSKDYKSYLAENLSEKPDELAPDWIYENINEVIRNCRRTFFLFLGLLSYSLLTAFTTSDKDLIFGQNVSLPFIDANITLYLFILLAPFTAICLFVCIQLYLIKINKLIDFAFEECRKKKLECEDTCDLHNCKKQQNRIYPWIILFSKHPKEKFVRILQIAFVKFSLWWLLPMVMIVFSLFVVKKHELFSSYYLWVITLTGTAVVLYFWNISNAKEILGKFALILFVLLFATVYIILISKTNEGILWSGNDSWNGELNYKTKFFRGFSLANLRNQKFDGKDLEGIRLEGANLGNISLTNTNLANAKLKRAKLSSAVLNKVVLKEANLNYADLSNAEFIDTNIYHAQLIKANLVQAKLREANFSKANLKNADLRNADLWSANLSSTVLIAAKLQDSDLHGAKLSYADLQGANLRRSNLQGADLKNVNLKKANLSGADLWKADIQGANLEETNLQEANLYETKGVEKSEISKAKNYKLAFYDVKQLRNLGLPLNHNENVKNKNFIRYDLSETLLMQANLQNANFLEANLKKSNLQEANLNLATFHKADLRGTDLNGASLQEADLKGANLRNSVLKGANLLYANLCETKGLNKNELSKAKNYKLALYDMKLLKNLGLPPSHNENVKNKSFIRYDLSEATLMEADLQNANFQEANLQKSNLQGANLKQANFQKADLREADLLDANLQGADLREIQFSSHEQFSKAETLYQAQIDSDLKGQLQNNYPILFKKPML